MADADLTRNVIYRGFVLNDEDITDNIIQGDAIGSGISGCILEDFDLTDVDIIQWMEKRSQQDGFDALEPFLGVRKINAVGTLYALDRNLLFDALNDLRLTMSAPLAYRDEPADKGFQPLYFSQPTNRIEDYPEGIIELQVLAMPHKLRYSMTRDAAGGDDSNALAVTFQASWVCRNPAIFSIDPVTIDLTATVNASGTWTNRGNYHSAINMLFVVGHDSGTITITAGGSSLVITVPSSSNDRIIRVKGADKIVTVEELGVESDKRSWLTFTNNTNWPMVPGGDSTYSIVFAGGIDLQGSPGDSRIWFYETYA
jgi:hypothetical protein